VRRCLHLLEEIYVLHEKEDWVLNMSDLHGSITNLPKLFEDLVIESFGLIKEAVLAIDNREDDILENQTAKTNTEFLIQKVLSAFAFALENAATGNYFSTQTDIPSDTRRLLYCLNNCRFTQTIIIPNIVTKISDLEQLSLDKPVSESINMYSVLDQKMFDHYHDLKCEPIIAIIEPNMYSGKFDWAKCVRPTGARNYVMFSLVEAICQEVNRLYCCIQRMNSNGCVQAWVDIKCIEAGLKPYINKESMKFLAEAVKPLLVLEKDKDKDLVTFCVEQFCSNMKRHLQCLSKKQ